MLLWGINFILVVLLGMLGVAFITLLERKILGLTQIRLGPNKVTWLGLLQPVADGVKLLLKQLFLVESSQSLMFLLSPFVLLLSFISIWGLIGFWGLSFYPMKFSGLLLFSFWGISTYAVILSGWAIMSSFSKLGSLRSILQSLSYEVALILIFMFALGIMGTLMTKESWNPPIEVMLVWIGTWLLLSLMESNRAPFDLLEGESELISGFNIEMGSLLFVLLFLSEYGMVMVMPLIGSQFVASGASALMISSFMSGSILLIRSCYPRIRYDVLMALMWQTILPASIFGFSCILMA